MTVDLATRQVVDTGYTYQATQLLPVDAATETFIEKTLNDHAPEWDNNIATVLGFPGKETIAGIAAKAAAQTLGAKAGIVEVSTVWSTWTTGGVTPQKMLDTFKVEREKPGTLGFNAMTLTTMAGDDLIALRDMIDTGAWRLYIDGAIEPQEAYTVAFQKRGAYNAASYFPGVTIGGIVEKREMWDILVEWGKKRQKECRYLDSDNKIPLCF